MYERCWRGMWVAAAIVAAVALAPSGCGSTASATGTGTGGVGMDASAGSGGTDGSTAGGNGAGGSHAGVAGPCASDKVCAVANQLCDPTRHVCVECRSDADCAKGSSCSEGACVAFTSCVNSRDCPADQVCDEAAGRCVQCLVNGDCASTSLCENSVCHTKCGSDKDCTPSGQLCDSGGFCTDCRKDADCGTGSHCDRGTCVVDVCDPLSAVCLATDLYTCDAHGAGYTDRTCDSGCSDTGGAHCAGDGGSTGGAGGSGGTSGCGDTNTSDANCGACGYACVHGRHCVSGRCSPAWQALATTGAPAPRTRHEAGFVGGKYVVLGGAPALGGVGMNSVAAYDVATDTWSPLASLNAARCSHEAVSTGTTILTFGGLSDCGNGGTTGPGLETFTPNSKTGTWSPIVVSGTPTPRYLFASTWTGNAMFIYGGGGASFSTTSSGALFSPSLSSWKDATCPLAGSDRAGYATMFNDGDTVRVWAPGSSAGLAYNFTTGWSNWTPPVGSDSHLAQRFADDGRRLYYLTAINGVSIYDRQTTSWLANDTSAMPSGFCIEGATAWTGTELIAWSGSTGAAPVAVGGRYQPPAP